MTSDLQLVAEYAAKAVSEQRRNAAEHRGAAAEPRGESAGAGGDESPKVLKPVDVTPPSFCRVFFFSSGAIRCWLKRRKEKKWRAVISDALSDVYLNKDWGGGGSIILSNIQV